MRISLSILLLVLLPLAAFAKARPSTSRRQLRVRTLVINDTTSTQVQEIHCAGRIPTTLAFRQPIDTKQVVLADANNVFLPPKTTERSILLIPNADLPSGMPTTLTVTLQDGTILPFVLSTVPNEADVQVDIDVQLQKRAAPQSLEALKTTIGQLRGQLDECQANTDVAGVSKIASLILKQDLDQPAAFDRHGVHKLDKQNGLLVELKQAYRLFGQTYVVLTLENRDPTRAWVLDHPEIAVAGGGQASDVKITSVASDVNSLAPDETERVVISFATPSQNEGQQYVLSLFERGGNRHIKLKDLSL